MLSRVRTSFYLKLFFYFFASALLMAVLTALLVMEYSSARAWAAMRERTQAGVHSIAQNMDGLLKRCAEGIRGLADDRSIINYLAETNNTTRYDIAPLVYLVANNLKPDVSVFIKRISDGEIVSAGALSPIFEPDNFNLRYTMIGRFLENEKVGVYNTVRGINMLQDTRIILGTAVMDSKGLPMGLVIMEIGRESLAQVVSGYSFISNQPIIMIDYFDTVLYNSQDETREGLNMLNFQSDLSVIWRDAVLQGSFHEDNIVWGKTYFAPYAIVGAVPQDLISAFQISAYQAIFPVLVLTSLLSLLFAYLAAQRVSLPIRRMTLAMKEVEKGNFQASVPVTGTDEIGRLSAAFNHMQHEIQELIIRDKQKQRNLHEAEIKALSLQVNPHFLYNSLDLIKWSIKLGQKDQAVQVVVQLGNLLRQLMNNQEDTITVKGELNLLEAYLEIQKLRWQERLTVQFEIDPDILCSVIPKLMLQPLVENALIHGLDDLMEGGIMRVSGCKTHDGEYLCFCVEDNGKGMSPQKLEELKGFVPDGMYHIGLSNLHQRSKLFGDERCGLEINSTIGQGTSILLTVKCIC